MLVAGVGKVTREINAHEYIFPKRSVFFAVVAKVPREIFKQPRP